MLYIKAPAAVIVELEKVRGVLKLVNAVVLLDVGVTLVKLAPPVVYPAPLDSWFGAPAPPAEGRVPAAEPAALVADDELPLDEGVLAELLFAVVGRCGCGFA